MTARRGIYIHIPFCVRKCNYCAFLSFDAETSPRREYADALIREIELRAAGAYGEACSREAGPLDSIYIGGGTPSVMDISQLADIMRAVTKSYDVRPGAEITLEANPGTLGRKDGVTLAKLQAYRYMGVNRLSMGVQSMDNDRLHFLGRIHTAENVERDMELIRRKGFDNVNLDLIFSVPGETGHDALSDLSRIIALGPEHISCYSLQIEEGTPFGDMADRGELIEVPDEEDRGTYHRICRVLGYAGYEHYEISNFARKGADASGGPSPYRSRHNSLYWDMSDYIGAGLGASGFAGGVRYRNTDDLGLYIRSLRDGNVPIIEEHVNTSFDNISEAVFTGLRRREGITYEEAMMAYRRADGLAGERFDGRGDSEAFWDIFGEARAEAERYAEHGLLEISDDGLRLTEAGIDISNGIMSLFV